MRNLGENFFKRFAFVSHGGMINMLFRSFMKMPIGMEYSIHHGDTAVHYWAIAGEKRSIIFINKMDHLEGLEGLEGIEGL